MRRVTGIIVLIALGVSAFKFLEPVFVWRIGWADLPTAPPAVESQSADQWAQRGEDLDLWLAQTRSALCAPSLSAAVSVDGEIVWAGAVGHADVESDRRATIATQYRIGSSSKAVTSAATGVLIDNGDVELDAPLLTYMPDLAAPLAGVTVRQAMSHTGGVRNYGLCLCFPIWEYLNRRHYAGAQRDTLKPFEASPLRFPPGEGFAYTSLGYNALGGVIEAASGERFGAYLTRAVLAPLAMASTTLETGEAPASAAIFYEVEGRRFKPAFSVDNSNKLPSGGMLSTPSDMTRLGDAMMASALFSLATRDLILTPQQLKDGSANDQGYALGWRYNPAGELKGGAIVSPRYSHHGTAQGATSYFVVYPDYRLTVSVMMNKGETSLDALGEKTIPMIESMIDEITSRQGGAINP